MSVSALSEARIWAALAEYLRHACSLFGMPAQLAQKLWLGRAEHKRIAGFLRVLEDILRRLIFLRALDLAPTLAPRVPPEQKRRARRGMPTATGAAFDMANSESWRVNFKLQAAADRGLPARNAVSVHRATADNISSAPSAQRLEALIRGFNSAERLAETLARKLVCDARAARRYISPISKKRAALPGALTLAELTPVVIDAHQRFARAAFNSS